jgi:hypothetical protein
MPVGLLVTIPVPVPDLFTVTVAAVGTRSKVATTVWLVAMTVMQAPVPVHPPPLQPAKFDPVDAVAVSVTELFVGNEALQVSPQSMPVGLLVTVPVPVPDLFSVSVAVWAVVVLKVATTVWLAVMTAVHVSVPVHPPPLQPAKADSADAVAVSVTELPVENGALQVAPQLMPDGLLVTVPAPVPVLFTVRVEGTVLNVAVTGVFWVMTTTHVVVPLHPLSLQPSNVEPADGVAVNVTVVPLMKVELHVTPQSIPAGLLVTVPSPAPALVTVRVNVGRVAKLAETVWSAFIVTIHEPVPLQPAPLQPVNVEPAAGAAVRVTVPPTGKFASQVGPHEMPLGLLDTVPLPDFITVKWRVFGMISIDSARVACCPKVSATRTVNWKFPVAVGIPVIVPEVELMVRPGGSDPAEMLQVSGAVPVASTAWL